MLLVCRVIEARPLMQIPISLEWMPIIMMGFGVFLLLFFVADLLRYASARLKGKAFDKVWDDKTQDFVPNTLSRRARLYLTLILMGSGLFFLGYSIYTGFLGSLIWELFSPANFLFMMLAALALLILVFVFSKMKD